METTKLTLSIPKKVLRGAKTYSQKTHQPLSQLVTHYFSVLIQSFKKNDPHGVTPRVQNITGIVRSSESAEDLLFDALTKKYK